MNLGGPDSGFDDLDDAFIEESSETKIDRLTKELAVAQKDAADNWQALKLLTSICKERGFNPFPGIPSPLAVHPSKMTREELLERNQEATKRIRANRHVASADAIPQSEGFKSQLKQVEEHSENPIVDLIVNAKTNGGVITVEEYQKAVQENSGKTSVQVDSIINTIHVDEILNKAEGT